MEQRGGYTYGGERLNNIALAQAVQKAVKPKFYGHKTLKSKVVTRFPANLANEHALINRQYMMLLNTVLKNNLPKIRRAVDTERTQSLNMRTDADPGISRMIQQIMEQSRVDLETKASTFGLDRKIQSIAKTTQNYSIREWKRVVRKTLGIDILDDYYAGEFFKQSLQTWTRNNVGLIKTLADESLTRMENIIQSGYLRGAGNKELAQLIYEAYETDKAHAVFIARDQTAKLNAELTQQQQTDAGVTSYVWSDSGDSRVRSCHAELNGKSIKWSEPPEMWYVTKKRGRVYTGRHCHPGEDYDCRCVALPEFDIDTLSLPWVKNGSTK